MNRATVSGKSLALRQPSTPPSVERLLKTVPSAGRTYVLRAFIDAAREEYATTETIVQEMQCEFSTWRTGKAYDLLDSYMTHCVGFAMHRQFIESPHQIRDLANYALHIVVYEANLQIARGQNGNN